MINDVYCHFCKQELIEKGALIFSPPYRLDKKPYDDVDIVNKFHVCCLCFIQLMADWKPSHT